MTMDLNLIIIFLLVALAIYLGVSIYKEESRDPFK